MNENVEGIAAKEGYAHLRRLRGYARYVERAMMDALDAKP
jgi:hypothetical protein